MLIIPRWMWVIIFYSVAPFVWLYNRMTNRSLGF